MPSLHRKTEDPVRGLNWRARQAWRRTARRIVAEHVRDILAQLHELQRLPMLGIATSATGVVRVVLPGWAVTLSGVSPGAQAALAAAMAQSQCYVSNSGRYGRFWWLAAINQDPTSDRRQVILGSRLILTAIEDGRPRRGDPDRNPVLRVS